MTKYARMLVLSMPGALTRAGVPAARPNRYLSNEQAAVDVFRRTPHLNEATLRPVRGSDIRPATLRRTSAGAVVILRSA
jgi:hypothetical protein